VHDGLARLFSGAGIVEASDPAEELAETDLKFRTLLEATAGP
jgi:isochorismate synthase